MTEKKQDSTQNKSKESNNESHPKDGVVSQDKTSNQTDNLNKGKDGKDYF